MFDIDYIIPCYGKSEIIRPGLRALANQWHSEYIHVVLVNDCSPNTDCDYQDLVDEFSPYLDIKCIRTKENYGQGLCRQTGIDATSHDYFMLQDEDDLLANPLAVSMFIGNVEANIYKFDKNNPNVYLLDEDGKMIRDESKPEVAVVSGPLFEFDDNHTHIIESHNHVWLNSKLYNRKFIEKHNIRFNKAQSRHAEDYFFTSCFFWCLDYDKDYIGLLMENEQLVYLWYPNKDSQSRRDEHYGFMLSGYTMNGSVNILNFERDFKLNKVKYQKDIEDTTIKEDDTDEMKDLKQLKEAIDMRYRHDVLNMTVYSFFTFLSFIRRVSSTEYVPELELDWYILRDSCNELRKLCMEFYDTYTYTEKIDEYHNVHSYTDVQFTEPWVDFDTYIVDGTPELEWSFEEMMKNSKEVYKFNEFGFRVD